MKEHPLASISGMPERPLSVAEAATWLGYDPTTARRLINHKDEKKRLTATKVGGQWRITRAHSRVARKGDRSMS